MEFNSNKKKFLSALNYFSSTPQYCCFKEKNQDKYIYSKLDLEIIFLISSNELIIRSSSSKNKIYSCLLDKLSTIDILKCIFTLENLK
jgi:hypothetical protein